MKKIYSFLIVLLSPIAVSDSTAQNPHPWELGLNGGAAWLKSDVKMKKLGPGFGFTFGQTYCYNETSPLFWGWRFRYLGATTYGQDYQKSFDKLGLTFLTPIIGFYAEDIRDEQINKILYDKR